MAKTGKITIEVGVQGIERALEIARMATTLAMRERELLVLKGPCSNTKCRLHYAHSGPCVPPEEDV